MQTRAPLDEVDIEDLVRQSQADRAEAGRLLDEFGLLAQWQPYGDVEVAGSYRSDLMLRSDIDLYVVNPAVDLDLAFDALNHFVRRGEFLRFGFIDTVRGMPPWANPETFPTGYFLGMAREFHGREWKVEAWLVASPPPRPEWIAERLTDEGRRTILRLKHQKRAGQLAASGYDICRAVLLGAATSAEQAEAWLQREGKSRP